MSQRVALLIAVLFASRSFEAAAEIDKADTLSHDPEIRSRAYVSLASDRKTGGDLEGAIRALQTALHSAPDDPQPYYQLGLALRDHGSIPLAIRVLRSYIRIEADTLRASRAQQVIRQLGGEPPLSPFAALQQEGYIGPQACAECHKDKYEGFSQTAHAMTSSAASAASVHGIFHGEASVMWTGNPNLWYEMSASEDGFFQTVNSFQDNRLFQRRQRIDVVVGSGKIGQSYLSWRGDRLFQLPVSSYGDSTDWINSPGFPDGTAVVDRPIIPRCLECHSTYFQSLDHDLGIHGRSGHILAVTCERCHGPGADHALLAATDAQESKSRIVHPGRLPSSRLIEICAQCHSDTGPPRREPFAFRPGDSIAEFYEPGLGSGGVHAVNQVGRLRQSRCFQESQEMSCITCHDPHQLERGNTALFSSRCQTCHNVDVCDMAPELGPTIRDNCIDCHMPRRDDGSTQIESATGLEHPVMPEHRIGIYQDATRSFLARQAQQ
jgi:hypothetical protein